MIKRIKEVNVGKWVYKWVMIIIGLTGVCFGFFRFLDPEPYPFFSLVGLVALIYGIVCSTKYGLLCRTKKSIN